MVLPTLESMKPSLQTTGSANDIITDGPLTSEKTTNDLVQTEQTTANPDNPAPNSARGDNLPDVRLIMARKIPLEE